MFMKIYIKRKKKKKKESKINQLLFNHDLKLLKEYSIMEDDSRDRRIQGYTSSPTKLRFQQKLEKFVLRCATNGSTSLFA